MTRSLHRFDGERYALFDYVVMPNHVHLLAAFPEADAMHRQCASWKHFTAALLNVALRRAGRFWESESFDHLVRTEGQFRYLRRYIAENPAKAGLRAGEYAHYSRPDVGRASSDVNENQDRSRSERATESATNQDRSRSERTT
ncbi:MAG: transposase [Fimbriiglobus sp.]